MVGARAAGCLGVVDAGRHGSRPDDQDERSAGKEKAAAEVSYANRILNGRPPFGYTREGRFEHIVSRESANDYTFEGGGLIPEIEQEKVSFRCKAAVK